MTRPNILFLLPDQLRPDFMGCYGADFLKTPAIDEMAAAGTVYEAAISPSPICVPARASMLTGQSAARNGVIDNVTWLRPDRREMGIATWPELLSDGGYQTASIGKMHFYPWDISEGFETRIIAEDKRHIHVEDDYDVWLKGRGLSKLHGNQQDGYQEQKGASITALPDDAQVDRWVANKAAEWLQSRDDPRPFALMVGFPGPHCPYDPPKDAVADIEETKLPGAIAQTDVSSSQRAAFIAGYKRAWAELDYTDLSDDEIRRLRRHYAALVERLDADVATILEALEESGQLENTIVVFASDHGDYLGDFGLVGKTFFHEASIRVPLIVTDFRKQSPARDNSMRSLLDLFPSFLEWAELERAEQAQGQALSENNSARIICGMTTFGVMARSGTHKLVRYKNGAQALYDIVIDPTEQVNRIDDPELSQIRNQLEAELIANLIDDVWTGHSDKRVKDAQAIAPQAFFRLGWSRPYPAN